MFRRLLLSLSTGLVLLYLHYSHGPQILKAFVKPRKRALIIGVEGSYEQPIEHSLIGKKKKKDRKRPGDCTLNSRGTHKDANYMYEILIDLYGYTPADITFLVDDCDPSHIQPTKNNVLMAIDELVREPHAGDRFVFFFTGCSDQGESDRRDREDNYYDSYIWCCDGESITAQTLNERLVQPLPSGCILRLVIDSSHSGSLLDLEHATCNRVYVPWISKGMRRTGKTLWYNTVKQNAMLSDALLDDWAQTTSTNMSSYSTSNDVLPSSTTSSIPAELAYMDKALPSVALTILTSDLGDGRDSATNLTSSPLSRVCDGITCFLGEENIPPRADVLCLSSSRSDQVTWKDHAGRSMTVILVEFLRDNNRPTLHSMMTHVSHKMHDIYVELHFKSQEYRKLYVSWARGSGKFKRPAVMGETVNFQDPELCSQFPISPREMKTRVWDM